jgi:hypothetical protein
MSDKIIFEHTYSYEELYDVDRDVYEALEELNINNDGSDQENIDKTWKILIIEQTGE